MGTNFSLLRHSPSVFNKFLKRNFLVVSAVNLPATRHRNDSVVEIIHVANASDMIWYVLALFLNSLPHFYFLVYLLILGYS